jgi:wyosine [tRNA(Phe)-imidazoG37] synthetase (radical SAM superfamily)
MQELRRWISANPGQAAALDFITFSGAGEPTLHSGIGGLIRQIKKETSIPVCVITNSSFLGNKRVRKALLDADLVVPSLDAVDQLSFRRVDRPSANIRVSSIIRGLEQFRKEYKGRLWLEVMIVKGYNDSIAHARELKKVLAIIKPQVIQINSPVRHTAEAKIMPADPVRLKQIRKILGTKATVV